MRISELIETLESMKSEYGDINVMTSGNYGDIAKTEQLFEIYGIDVCIPVESAYSHSGLAFPTSDGSEEDGDEKIENMMIAEDVLVIRDRF